MPPIRNAAAFACVTAAALHLAFGPAPAAQGRSGLATIAPTSLPALREWDARTQSMLRSGELRLRQVRADTLLAGHVVERADQYYRGVRVHGADISRQVDEHGVVQSVFGNVYDGIDIESNPALTAGAARARVAELSGAEQSGAADPELVVLPRDEGGFRLAWRMRAVTAQVDIVQYFLDAASGDVLLQYSDRQSQSAVGRAAGVLGDSKKISVTGATGSFTARDLLRPPVIETEDMKGDPARTEAYLDGLLLLGPSDLASSTDNNWTDVAVSDAHVYSGYTYDYYFKRFGRRGLDDSNIRIRSLANPVRRTATDLARYFNSFPDFFVNAFYAGNGVMVYGVGLPPGFTLSGQAWNYVSGALDIVAHELTHGVTQFSSNLIYRNESGALNEAFSDIMGTSAEFFFQAPGNGPLKADYLCGEDVVTPGGLRSMENPGALGDPDHYSRRFLGTGDNGGVHTNSGIANHAFYLAIEGGTNRTSGLGVQGVGGANREQMEKVFYRAFTQMLPANATFATARAATIQAARDLYGANSAAERAVTQAWTAVGVN
ncbi:MAG TPA: M4 family metallopeptidase [Vicinamibacterales bacterium]|nr:M4 family metallopeptidase [Vicinamibacterales bacterium]